MKRSLILGAAVVLVSAASCADSATTAPGDSANNGPDDFDGVGNNGNNNGANNGTRSRHAGQRLL